MPISLIGAALPAIGSPLRTRRTLNVLRGNIYGKNRNIG